ncbi:sensor histidine kinase [Parashewanella spongiae]|nr:PAS domain-containing sensor histidine kinase [Parashewanella spongiae]
MSNVQAVTPINKHAQDVAHPSKANLFKGEVDNMSSRVEHILQAMPSGIVILDGNGMVTQANPVALELLGEPLEGQKWLTIINRAFSPQKDDGHEVSLRNGRRVKLAITPLSPEPGQLIVLTDLTETRQLQQNLSHLQRLSSLGKMVAKLAHQVRTPLSAAMLYASNLKNPKLPEASKAKFQDKLINRLNQLEHQVNDMLLMARGRQNQQGEPVSFEQVLEQVSADCEPIAEKKNCTLRFINESSAQLMANENALSSAINNLVMNSLEAGAKNVTVKSCERQSQLFLEVIDDGKGLESGTEKRILEPFYTTKAQGTGLGLAVVQSVVRNHNGNINLKCELGKGCHFILSFPALSAAA